MHTIVNDDIIIQLRINEYILNMNNGNDPINNPNVVNPNATPGYFLRQKQLILM